MIRAVRKTLSRQIGGLHEAAFLLATASITSALLGVLRDRLFAHLFGASADLDIYYAAFKIPDLLYVTVASFVSTTVLIPILSQQLRGKEYKAASEFLSEMLTLFAAGMALIALVVGALYPALAPYVAPGFHGAEQQMYILLTRILLLSPLLLGISNILGGVTQSMKQFVVFAFSPIVYNLGIVFGVLVFYPSMGLSGLAWGVVLGAALHGAVQLPAVLDSPIRIRARLRFAWVRVRQVLALSIPRALGLGTANELVDTVFTSLASTMPAGSISQFAFAYNMQGVLLGAIGVAYSTAAFPQLAALHGEGAVKQFSDRVVESVESILLFSFPLMALLVPLRSDIVRLFLGTGKFTEHDVEITGALLALFILSLAAQGLLLLFTRSYYAAGKTKKPVIANLLSMVGASLLAYWWVGLYGSNGEFRELVAYIFSLPPSVNAVVLMLPLAFTTGMLVNSYLHWRGFREDFEPDSARLRRALLSLGGSAFFSWFVLTIFRESFLVSFPNLHAVQSALTLIAVGLLVNFAALTLIAPEYSKRLLDLARGFVARLSNRR